MSVARDQSGAPVFAGAGGFRSRSVAQIKSTLSRPAVFGSLIPVVTVLNAVVGMLLPQMMQPQAFGEYSLVVSLFNYGLIFDLGMSQIMDRWVPARLDAGLAAEAQRLADTILWLRLAIGIGSMAAASLILAGLAARDMLPFGASAGLLAVFAGLTDMVALGPVCVYRARSRRRNYAIMITTLLSGLVIARLGGLAAGGITGCFTALTGWYLCCALLFHRRMPLRRDARPHLAEAMTMLRVGLPFFATSFIWAFYVTGNRWLASFVIDGEQFGQFAFSANIFSLLVGAVGGFSAFYYPRLAGRIANSPPFAQSGRLLRDIARLIAAVTAVMGIGIILAGILIRLIYPQYVAGIDTARVILVGVTPMVVASWLMPISQSASRRPWIDGVIIFPTATVILAVAIMILAPRFGAVGIAWASTISALPLVAVQLVALYHAGILRARDGQRLFILTAASCLALGGLAWGMVA